MSYLVLARKYRPQTFEEIVGQEHVTKTLEEPPPHAVFIFATTEVHKIPITILSRVQRYDFRLVSSQRIAEHLAKVLGDEHIAFDAGALSVVAREAGGSVRDALSLLEQ